MPPADSCDSIARMAGAAEHDDKINVRERTDRSIRHVYGVRVDHCRTLMLKKVETARMVPPAPSCPRDEGSGFVRRQQDSDEEVVAVGVLRGL